MLEFQLLYDDSIEVWTRWKLSEDTDPFRNSGVDLHVHTIERE